MSNKHHKVSFNFVNSLPDNQLPIDDEFAFYYVKKFTNYKGSNINIPSLYLYNTHENKFVELTPPTDYIIHTINNKNSVNGTVTLSVDDLLSINPNITQPFKINNNRLFANGELTYFSNLSSSQLTDIDTINRTLILGSDFGDSSTVINSENNIFIGQHQKLQNRLFTNNLIIGNDFQTPEDSTYALNNNMFLGGVWYDNNNQNFNDNKVIENNIFIKNLGYGNKDKSFKFVTKLSLSLNTSYITPSDLNVSDNLVISRGASNDEIVKLPLNQLNIDTILGFGNYTTKTLLMKTNHLYVSDDGNSVSYDSIGPEKLNSSITFGSTSATRVNTSVITGKNSFNTVSFVNIFGNNNKGSITNTNIVGNNNSNTVSDNNENNNIFGNDNGNLIQSDFTLTNIVGNDNVKKVLSLNNNNIFGNNNGPSNSSNSFINNLIFGNSNLTSNNFNYSNNIIFGNNNPTETGLTNSMIFGNYVHNAIDLHYPSMNKNNIFAIDNYTSPSSISTPLIMGDFGTKTLSINGVLYLDVNQMSNANLDVTYTRMLAQNTSGQIGYINKADFFKVADKFHLEYTTGTQSINFGNIPNTSTGTENFVNGYDSGSQLTTGYYNQLFGIGGGKRITEGSGNLGFGPYCFNSGDNTLPMIGNHNITFGLNGLGTLTTGCWNITFGNGSLPRLTKGNGNLAFGYSIAPYLVTGNNNLLLGNGAGGTNASGAQFDNKLIIEHQPFTKHATNFWDSPTGGHYSTDVESRSLVYGDFLKRTFRLNARLTLNPTQNVSVEGDTSFNKYLVVDENGQVGTKYFTPPTVITTSNTDLVRIRLTDDFTVTSSTRTLIPNWTFEVRAGKVYKINILGGYKTVATTTGGSLGFILSNGGVGTIMGYVKMGIVLTNTAAPEQTITDINTVATTVRSFATSTGVGAANTIEHLKSEVIFECTADGVLSILWGSEINNSGATLAKNTILEIIEI